MRHWPLVPLLVFLVFAGLAFIAAEMILLIPVVDLPSPSPVVAYGASVGVGFGITAGSGASSGIALNFLLLTKPYPDAFVIHHFVLAAVLFTLGALATLYDWWTHVRIPATPSARAAATETENRAQLFRHQARARARLRAALRRAPWLRAVAWALGIALPLADVAALGILCWRLPMRGVRSQPSSSRHQRPSPGWASPCGSGASRVCEPDAPPGNETRTRRAGRRIPRASRAASRVA